MQLKKYYTAAALVVMLSSSMLVQAQTSSIQAASSTVIPELAAVIKAPNMAILSSQTAGLIEQVNVQEGDSFKAGDVLLSLDCTLHKASLTKAQAHYNYADKDYKSTKALAALNSASEMQIALSKSEFAKAAADLHSAKYQVEQCTVKAPYDGSVVRSWVHSYENIEAKGELFEIVNNGNLVAEFLAPSNLLTSLVPGKAIELKVNETQKTYSAIIQRIVPHIDSVSQTIKVIGTFEQSQPDLWSGMSGWAVIP